MADPKDQDTQADASQECTALVDRTNQSVLLRSGYTLACNRENEDDVLSVIGQDGTICLRMTLGKEGPLVEMRTRSFKLAATEELLEQSIGGDIRMQAGGAFTRRHTRKGSRRDSAISSCARTTTSPWTENRFD